MFLSHKLLRLELQRHGHWKDFLDYRTCIQKVVKHSLRITFLEECCKAEIIPRFLKFRIPNNGCFDDKSVHDFQKRLLKKELANGRMDLKQSEEKVIQQLQILKEHIPYKLVPSVILYIRIHRKSTRESQKINLTEN